MDLITLDVTKVPANVSRPGDFVDLIGPHNPPDAVAERAGTIGYEILTSLGARYMRAYIEPGAAGGSTR
jgi:alanine racemase